MATHYYISQHIVSAYASNGRLKRTDCYQLHLMHNHHPHAGGGTGRYTCEKFRFQMKDKPERSIPALAGWSYDYDSSRFGTGSLDENGWMWGIPHPTFENLVDSDGERVSIEAKYQIYSAFIYYHGWCCGLATEAMAQLNKTGDRAALQTPPETPLHFGSEFLEGSVFEHGQSAAEYKGVGVLNGAECALIGFEEVGGGFRMYIKPMPLLRVKTTAGTQIAGELWVDLESRRVRKTAVTITDMTRTTMLGIPVDVSVIVTRQNTLSVSEGDFREKPATL